MKILRRYVCCMAYLSLLACLKPCAVVLAAAFSQQDRNSHSFAHVHCLKYETHDRDSYTTLFSFISADRSYLPPREKSIVSSSWRQEYITEGQVFKVLDHLRLDLLPAWFLKVGAQDFNEPIVHLCNLAVATSVVPLLWKQASK